MEGCSWIVGGTAVLLLLSLTGGDAILCAGNFTELSEEDQADNSAQFVPLPSTEVGVEFTEWIFPNTLTFPCSGQVFGWRFRTADISDLSSIDRLPRFGVYFSNQATLNDGDYNLRKSSGAPSELSQIAPGLYQYTLVSPVAVQSGDIFGIRYATAGGAQLQLLFEDGGAGTRPESFRREFTGSAVFDASGSAVESDTRYFPIVSMITANESSSTITPSPSTTMSIVPSSTMNTATLTMSSSLTEVVSTPSPTPTTIPPITTEEPTTVIVTTEKDSTTEELKPKITTEDEPDAATSDAITTNPTTTDPGVVATDPGDPGVQSAIIIGVVAGLLCVIILMGVAALIALIIMKKRRHHFKVPNSEFVSPLDNPTYEVNMEDDGKGTGPLYASLKDNAPNITFTPSPYQNGDSAGYCAPHHVPVEAQQHQLNSSLEYSEVGPSPTTTSSDSRRFEPQDYATPVASANSTLDLQPYEVPLNSLEAHNNSKVSSPDGKVVNHEYRVLEGGIYVPTGEEREQYMASTASSSSRTFDESIYSRISQKYHEQLRGDSFFLEDEHYWAPASSKTALYNQLSKKKYREIPRSRIRIIKHLGSGQFGSVNLGEWQQSGEVLEVAVKNIIPLSSDEDKVKFLQEAAIMGQFLHPNVVKLYGVVTMGEPVMIVLEYMAKGDLSKYLQTQRPKQGETVDSDLPNLLLKFCREVASGMEYLSGKSFVHRDLAARNILVGSDTTCKIGDFGMSRNLEDSNYYITHGGKIPVKWTAPEALNFRKYSTASDVWSFGAVMYETWSLGRKPFNGFSNADTMELIARGYRLPPPPGCPRALYELMIRCWHSDTVRRPVFSAIVKMLGHSDSHLLSWSTKDLSVHPEVADIGAPNNVSEDLYQDLQDYYSIKK